MRGSALLVVEIAAVGALVGGGARAIASPRTDQPAVIGVRGDDDPGKPVPPPSRPPISGTGTCPHPDAVWAELKTLVPRERLDARLQALAGTTGAAPMEIADLGRRYRVVVAGRLREYGDDARDCRHRARVTAVFIALTIDPPELAGAPPASQLAATPPAVPAAPPTRLRIEVGPALSAGLGSDERVTHLGVDLHVAGGADPLAIVAGALVLAPATTAVGARHVRQYRLPLDVAARATLARGRLALFGEAGVVAALLSARGTDLASNRTGTDVEMGARCAVGLRFGGRTALVPFLVARLEWVPKPAEVFALPDGVVGHTPRLWIGAAAGVSLGLL